MPRIARQKTETGVYHAILRGVNKQQIFECSEDYEHFVRILQRQCGLPIETRPSKIAKGYSYLLDGDDAPIPPLAEDCDVSPQRHCYLYAWCLMGNHVHLLLKEADEPIGDVMKRISSSYVYYYNHKYDRVGHLFQERFKSQPVEDWTYFLTLLRYIHQNPLKSHLVNDLRDYRWSSWNEFMGQYDQPFSSTNVVLSRITIDELSQQVNQLLTDEEEDGLLDVDVKPRKTGFEDDEVWQMLTQHSGATNATEFQSLPRPMQKHYLYLVHEQGVGPRTLSRLTGVSYSVVYKATSAANEQYLQMLYKQMQAANMACEYAPEYEEWLMYVEEDDFSKYPEY